MPRRQLRIARLSREVCGSDLVKIEIMRDTRYLLPDNQETIKATEILAKEGFTVMPYMYPDLNAARDMVQAGAACIMPLGAPIGSNKGLCTKEFIQILIDEIDLPIIVDAGIGRPSQACEAMEMGGSGSHGQYCYCNGRRCASYGRCLPQGYRSRKRGLPFWTWKSYGKRSQPFITPYRISSGLGAEAMSQENHVNESIINEEVKEFLEKGKRTDHMKYLRIWK